MYAVCERNSWGDPFSYARSKEILMAIVIKQQIASTFSGADGFDKDGGAEYKSTTGKTINCLLYTSPSPRDRTRSRMPSSA